MRNPTAAPPSAPAAPAFSLTFSQRAWRAIARWPQLGLIGAVQGYRYLLRPWLGNVCRFEPTCSAYALAALHQHGAVAGAYLASRRILRCHPGCPGGFDAVPSTPPFVFTRLFSSKTRP